MIDKRFQRMVYRSHVIFIWLSNKITTFINFDCNVNIFRTLELLVLL